MAAARTGRRPLWSPPIRADSRPATEADSALVYDIKGEAMRPYVEATWGWREDEQARLHARRFRPEEMTILLSGAEPVGYLHVRRSPDEIRLLSIGLRPAWQSRGIGGVVLEDLRREAGQRGVPLRLRVLRANPRARAFYERHGFSCAHSTDDHHHLVCAP